MHTMSNPQSRNNSHNRFVPVVKQLHLSQTMTKGGSQRKLFLTQTSVRKAAGTNKPGTVKRAVIDLSKVSSPVSAKAKTRNRGNATARTARLDI